MALLSSDFDEITDEILCEALLIALVPRVGAGVHTVSDIEPDDPSNISCFLALERTQAAPQSCRVNDCAFMNMAPMSLTLDTSHVEISQLNNFAPKNMLFMVVTLDTSQLEMSPSNDFAVENM